MNTKHPTLESTLHSLAHHIAKSKPEERSVYKALLGVIIENPENVEYPASLICTCYGPRPTAKVIQFEQLQTARHARRGVTA